MTNPWQTIGETIADQTETSYENYKKIKGFEDVGYFLVSYVVSGGVMTKNVTRNDTIDVSDIVVSLHDDVMARSGTSFKSKVANTTYFLDITKAGDWVWGTAHPTGTAGTDYLPIAEAVTDSNKNIGTITDMRGPIGGFRLKSEYGLFGYLREIINVKDYGAKGDGIKDDTTAIQAAINSASSVGGGLVYIPSGIYEINKDITILIPSNIYILGSGGNSTKLRSSKIRTVKIIEIAGDNIGIEKICIDGGIVTDPLDFLPDRSLIEINKGCNNIIIRNNKLIQGSKGIWINPTSRENISNVLIKDNLLESLSNGIYVGIGSLITSGRTDQISNVTITGNVIQKSYYQADGIKTSQRCNDLIISNNIISGQDRDAIDLFTSGDNVIVSNNMLKGNMICGIDIKQSTTAYPSGTYGYNRRMMIEGNIIDNNSIGISIAQIDTSTLDNYLITISNNMITGNTQDGVNANGNYINIINNMIYKNCSDTSGTFAGIRVQPRHNRSLKGVNINGNTIINNGNGNSSTGGYGIYLFTNLLTNSLLDSNISDNIIVNDSTLGTETPQQVGLYIGGFCKNISIERNKIMGHLRDVWVKNGADVHGKSIFINIGDVAAGAYNKYVSFVAKSAVSLIDATIINGATIAANVTDNVQFKLVKMVTGAFTNITNVTTSDTTINAWVPYVINNFPNNTSSEVANDKNRIEKDMLFGIQLSGIGAGKSLSNCTIEVRFIEY